MLITCLYGAEESLPRMFVYPYIHEFLNELNLAGKIIVYTLFTIAFLPALIVHYVALLGIFIVCALCVAFKEIFKKRG
jgi:hypothetical protein